jgi:hypothetical protein
VVAMKNKGQNVFELVILIALVSLGAVVILSMLGFNITSMFGNSNEEVKKYKPFDFAAQSNFPSAGSTMDVSNVTVEFQEDGSASFNVDGRDVTLSSDVLNNLNEVFETSGAEGINTYLMDALKSIIANSDPADGPIDIAFGEGYRTDKNDFNYWQGDSSTYNLVTIKTGDQVIVIQNDKQTSDPNGDLGVYRIDGTIQGYDGGTGSYNYVSDSISRLDKTDSQDNAYSNFTYESTIDLTSGINFEGDIFKNSNNDQGDWNISFTTQPASITN